MYLISRGHPTHAPSMCTRLSFFSSRQSLGRRLSLCRTDGYSSDANAKVYEDGSSIFNTLFLFFRLKQASGYIGATMKKQIRQINSVIAHPGPSSLSFLRGTRQYLKYFTG